MHKFQEPLAVAIPNQGSSLFEKTRLIFERIGMEIDSKSRKFQVWEEAWEELGIKELHLYRPQDIPVMVKDGLVDCGICGWDWVLETNCREEIDVVVRLPYAKKTSSPATVIVYGRKNSHKKIIDNRNIRVTAEYPNLAKTVFKKAIIDFSHGTTEAKVASGQYDYGVGVVESGSTLKENGLKIIKKLVVSPVVLIKNRKCSNKATLISLFGKILAGAFQSEFYRLIKMNVKKNDLRRVVEVLPALRKPTISKLINGNTAEFAIESVIPKKSIIKILPELLEKGASGIIVQKMEIIIPT